MTGPLNTPESASPHAYLITLRPLDSAPIQATCARLTALGFNVVLVEGVKGAELSAREYFQRTSFWRHKAGTLMTPGELGCTMSHEKALRMATEVGQGHHLVLEDDFIASDEALAWIADVRHHIKAGTILHLGGQEHLQRFYRYVRGRPLPGVPGAVHVNPADQEYLRCNVAYLLHAATARTLCELMAQGLFIADDFRYAQLQGAIDRVWFRWVVSHPVDQSASSIEGERRLLGRTTRRHWSYRSRMNWARLWRHLVSPPSAFLKNQQSGNQLPI